MKKLSLTLLVLLLILTSCQAKKDYPAKLQVEKDVKTYTYIVNGDEKNKKTLTMPTISDKENIVYPVVYSLNPLVENKNGLGLTNSTLYKEDDIDVSFKDDIYRYALYGYGYWKLTAEGESKANSNQVLIAEDYAQVQGDVFHSTNINNAEYDAYYLAAQELIWESIVDLKTEEKYKIDFEGIDLQPYKDAILTNIQSANNTPFFNGTVYNISQEDITNGTQIDLTDANQVIGQFDVQASEGIEVVSVSENVLSFVVKSLSSGSKIDFIPRFKLAQSVSQIFSSDEGISYLVIGSDNYLRNTSSLHIESISDTNTMSLVIETRDSDTKDLIYGGQFEISTGPSFENPIQSTLSVDGTSAVIDNLSPGTYYIQQIVAPTGYELNANVEKITIEAGVAEKTVPFLNKISAEKK